MQRLGFIICAWCLWTASSVLAEERIQLASDPALSPDGKTLLFSYRGDIWSAPTAGGIARPVTTDASNDTEAVFSPDGQSIAFVSDRSGSSQVYWMPTSGGTPQQLTFHTSGYSLKGWSPEGTKLLVTASRDHFWRKPERIFWIPKEGRTAEVPIFDDYGYDPSVSPDGKKILFTREGEAWWRKRYTGSQASQIWLFNTEDQSFQKLLDPPGGARWPLWKADGNGFFYAGGQAGVLNLRSYDFDTAQDKALTDFQDDAVVFPALSRDGKTLVFRHLFDFYRYDVGGAGLPQKIDLICAPDLAVPPELRRTFTNATDLATTKDGLELAIVAGGDVWVMETELREPRQITFSPEEERDVVFSPNGDAIWFVSDAGGQTDIWKAERKEPEKYWWQNQNFTLTKITDDAHLESQIRFSPDGSHVAFTKGEDLWIADANGENARVLLSLRSAPGFDWSPDGKWVCYSTIDDDYNSDIWVAPIDGSRPPYNLSRHPDNDTDPRWSPDGKMIAYTGRREAREVDVFIVHLSAQQFESSSRDRKQTAAVEKFEKARKGDRKNNGSDKTGSTSRLNAGGESKSNEPAAEDNAQAKSTKTADAPHKPVEIDFDGIHDRIRRISIPNSREGNLLWSHDSKKLTFSSTVDGKRGTYSIEFPENLRPTLVTANIGSSAVWLSEGNQIVCLVSGVPMSMVPGGRTSTYSFSAPQEVNRSDRMKAAFEMCWRTMRDRYYDAELGNNNWDEIRRKYVDVAAASVDERQLATVVSLMLGELNGSHLGFTPSPANYSQEDGEFQEFAGFDDATFDPLSLWDLKGEPDPEPETPQPRQPSTWRPTTGHLGLRFDPKFKGPGLKVRDVITGGPTSQQASRVKPGEVVLTIDGVAVDPGFDLTQVLNGRLDREIPLTVRDTEGNERSVKVRPVSYFSLAPKLYDMWVEQNRKKVDELSHEKLGYLHIRAMNDSSFNRFMEDLCFAGAGKEGLIIDVRENGGGSIADHLLTALSQPVHAITLARAGGRGYPQDRKIYATWNKPIVVLCNQNSFSNAEIFSHAIKTLKRGKLVGVPTAGGVISTGSARIMDIGSLRVPGRGWYVLDTGEDMELNGAVPDIILWPEPGQMPAGEDIQLAKGVEVLTQEVKAWAERPEPKLIKASERGK